MIMLVSKIKTLIAQLWYINTNKHKTEIRVTIKSFKIPPKYAYSLKQLVDDGLGDEAYAQDKGRDLLNLT